MMKKVSHVICRNASFRSTQINLDIEKPSAIPGVQSPGDKMVLFYTCKVCETRSVKQISKQAYNYGCVIVRCSGCQNLHLIADRKKLFEDSDWDIEKVLSQRGENVKVVTNETGVMELTVNDIIGDLKPDSNS